MRLVLFFTENVSLRQWAEQGLLTRELALYQEMAARGHRVTFVTYGAGEDERLAWAGETPTPPGGTPSATEGRALRTGGTSAGIEVCAIEPRRPGESAEAVAARVPVYVLHDADLIKTNQMPGGDVALAAARLADKPLIARCGYMWSESARRKHGAGSPAERHSLASEAQVFAAAAHVVVTTRRMRADVMCRCHVPPERISAIPNYVATQRFRPAPPVARDPPRLCFIGRLSCEKNVAALIDAVRGMPVELIIVGQGPEAPALRRLAAGNSRVRFAGIVANERLPELLRTCAAFVLPSLEECHPKALLEAMACGLPVIGSDVTGINEILTHGENGLLCPPTAAGLRAAIAALLDDAALRTRLGRAAQAYIEANCALPRIVKRELSLYETILDQRKAVTCGASG